MGAQEVGLVERLVGTVHVYDTPGVEEKAERSRYLDPRKETSIWYVVSSVDIMEVLCFLGVDDCSLWYCL